MAYDKTSIVGLQNPTQCSVNTGPLFNTVLRASSHGASGQPWIELDPNNFTIRFNPPLPTGGGFLPGWTLAIADTFGGTIANTFNSPATVDSDTSNGSRWGLKDVDDPYYVQQLQETNKVSLNGIAQILQSTGFIDSGTKPDVEWSGYAATTSAGTWYGSISGSAEGAADELSLASWGVARGTPDKGDSTSSLVARAGDAGGWSYAKFAVVSSDSTPSPPASAEVRGYVQYPTAGLKWITSVGGGGGVIDATISMDATNGNLYLVTTTGKAFFVNGTQIGPTA